MRSRLGLIAVLVGLALAWSAAPAVAERRVALVVGNAAYKDAPLRNPVNDARAMAGVLREVGFDVTLRENASKQSLERALAEFGEKLGPDAVGLFYYAGHAIQTRGQNFLVPVDAQIVTEARVRIEAVDADLSIEQMAAAGTRISLVILDACRNNPFEQRFRSAGEGGLAQLRAPAGTLIAYATAPGKVAVDGEGANSVYSGALVQALRQPGLAVEDVFKQVRVQVSRATGGQQVPWESSSLTGEFMFRSAPPAAVAAPLSPPAAQPASRPVDDPDSIERAVWAAAIGASGEGGLKAYLERYPQGRFADDAKSRIAALAPRRGRFDGRYLGTLRCPAERQTPPLNWRMMMEIHDDEALIDAQGMYSARFTGIVQDGGRLNLGGGYTSGANLGFTLRGAIEGLTYRASGTQNSGPWGRNCELEMYRTGD